VDTFFVKLWQAVVSGLSIGSVYALIAQGYYVTFITTGALNFGQGEFLMMGALFGLTCYVTLGLPYGLAVAGAVVLVGLMGVGLERVAIRPVLRHALSLSWVLSTVAISIILKNAAVQLWGPEQIKFPSPFGDAVLRVGPAGIFPQELFIIVAATGTVLLVQVFLKRAVLGSVSDHVVRHAPCPVLVTGANAADVSKRSSVFVITEHQSPEADARAFGISVAGDDKFLLLAALALEPIRAAAGVVL
jgi:branched-subunit amino acid ABC-type transport system permease component